VLALNTDDGLDDPVTLKLSDPELLLNHLSVVQLYGDLITNAY